eukprot:gene18194-biopygen21930
MVLGLFFWKPPKNGTGRNGSGRVRDASGTRPLLQILSCGTRPGRVRNASGTRPLLQILSCRTRPGLRPGRVRYFKFYRAGRVRDASGTRSERDRGRFFQKGVLKNTGDVYIKNLSGSAGSG